MAGLGARDSLRLEAGLCLYGNDIDQTTLPPSAVLLFTVPKKRRADGNFPGCAEIIKQQKEKPLTKRVGLVFEAGKAAPRQVNNTFSWSSYRQHPASVGVNSHVTNVKFRSFALIFNSKFGHKLYSFLKNGIVEF